MIKSISGSQRLTLEEEVLEQAMEEVQEGPVERPRDLVERAKLKAGCLLS